MFSSLSLEVKRALQEFLQFNPSIAVPCFIGGRPARTCHLAVGRSQVYKSLSNGRQQIHKLRYPRQPNRLQDLYSGQVAAPPRPSGATRVCFLAEDAMQKIVSRTSGDS